MGFLRHIIACNQHDPANFIPFYFHGKEIGKIRPLFAKNFVRWPQVFRLTEFSLNIIFDSPDLMKRSAALADVINQLIHENILCPLHGELYAVNEGHGKKPLLLIDRAIAPYFGIRSYGQHLNGFVQTGDGLKLWIARRAKDRANYPGCLDNFVAGGLPHGLNLAENLTKECWEEASVPAEIAATAIPAGAVSYNVDTSKGFNPFTLFCYDLELPQDFQPHCTDGEVECFYLWPVEKVMTMVKERDEFKLNCNLVIIDFLIRRGLIGPEDDNYLELIRRLHLPWVSAPEKTHD